MQPVTPDPLADNLSLSGKQPADNTTARPSFPGRRLTHRLQSRQSLSGNRLANQHTAMYSLARSPLNACLFADNVYTDNLYSDILSVADNRSPTASPLLPLPRQSPLPPLKPLSASASPRSAPAGCQQILQHFLCRFQLQPPPAAPAFDLIQPRMAAVLLPIILRSPPTLLFTVRSAHLKRHQGQVAFPGGVYDDADRTLRTTALRETEEEIAIPASAVHLAGTLPALDSTSGFRVTPFIGLISPDTRWQANTAEVASIFEIPLTHALTCAHYHSLYLIRQQRRQLTWFSWYQEHCIWGLTAKILWRLAEQMCAE